MRRSSMVALCSALAACSSDPTSPSASLPECTGPVTISVSSGTSPTFDWTPACRLFLVLVEQGAADQWMVISLGMNGITPPVRYGEQPPSAAQPDPTTPLQASVTYDVTLGRWTGPGRDDGVAVGNQDFTP